MITFFESLPFGERRDSFVGDGKFRRGFEKGFSGEVNKGCLNEEIIKKCLIPAFYQASKYKLFTKKNVNKKGQYIKHFT